jgi:hypothetical protein
MSLPPNPRTRHEQKPREPHTQEVISGQERHIGQGPAEVEREGHGVGGEQRTQRRGDDGQQGEDASDEVAAPEGPSEGVIWVVRRLRDQEYLARRVVLEVGVADEFSAAFVLQDHGSAWNVSVALYDLNIWIVLVTRHMRQLPVLEYPETHLGTLSCSNSLLQRQLKVKCAFRDVSMVSQVRDEQSVARRRREVDINYRLVAWRTREGFRSS